jgi:hypothetical protein
MSERRRGEKEDEKQGEKKEKEDEKRKGWDEKWRRDRVNAASWASILIWGALILLAETSGFGTEHFGWWEDQAWAVFFVGAGAILLLTAFFRLVFPEHRRAVAGAMILGMVFLGVGVGEIWEWDYVWVIVLVVVALSILFFAFSPRRR